MEFQNRPIQETIWQDQTAIVRNNQIVLNFSGHPVDSQWFPKNYKVVELPMQVNTQALNADKIIAEHIVKKLEEIDVTNLNFIPILVLPSYKPLIAPIIYIVTHLFGGKLPVISIQLRDENNGKINPKYLMPSVMRTRIRSVRPEYANSNGALVID
jgi:hypothetical protein